MAEKTPHLPTDGHTASTGEPHNPENGPHGRGVAPVPGQVISLAERRAQRVRAAVVGSNELMERAHRERRAFAFRPFDYNPDLHSLGVLEGDRPIAFLLEPDELRGLALTTEAARKLGADLCELADTIDAAEAPGIEPKRLRRCLHCSELEGTGPGLRPCRDRADGQHHWGTPK